MKTKLVLLLALTLGFILPVTAQSFVNLNFEAAQVVPQVPIFLPITISCLPEVI
jgi:hypothetical protein